MKTNNVSILRASGIMLMLSCSLLLFGKTTTSITNGNWSSATTWNNGIPANNDDVIINDTVTLDVNGPSAGISLTVNNGGSLVGAFTLIIKTSGALSISGHMDIGTLSSKNNATVSITATGYLEVDVSFTNDKNFTNDGIIVVNGTFTNSGIITGAGSVYAATYSNTGTIFGYTTTGNGEYFNGFQWTGGVDTDWNTGGNWLQTTAPSSTVDVEIPAGLTNYPIISNNGADARGISIKPGTTLTIEAGSDLTVQGTLNNRGTLIINSDATSTGSFINTGPINGDGVVNFNRYVTHNPAIPTNFYFHQVCTPITGQTLNDFDLVDDSTYAYEFTPMNVTPWDNWTNIFNPAIPVPIMKGLILSVYNTTIPADTIEFSGNIVSGDQNVAIAANDTNLIGNPYPSTISWDEFYLGNTGIDATTYIWDPITANYKSYVYSGGGSTGDSSCKYIQPGQAFFITSTGSASVNFTNSQRVHQHYPFLKSDSRNVLKIETSGGNGSKDNTYIRFREEGFTSNYDVQGEAQKWFSAHPEISTEIFTVSEDGYNMYINQMPGLNAGGYSMPLYFKPGKTDEFKLVFKGVNTFLPGTYIYLEDMLTKALHDCRESDEYDFYASKEDDWNRFKVHFLSTPFGVPEAGIDNNHLLISTERDRIYFSLRDGNNIQEWQVFDLLGQSVISGSNVPGHGVYINGAKGVYILKVSSEKNIYTKKFSLH